MAYRLISVREMQFILGPCATQAEAAAMRDVCRERNINPRFTETPEWTDARLAAAVRASSQAA